MSRLATLRAGLLLGIGLVAAVPGAGGHSAFELHSEVVSRYVFRGVVLDDAWSFQPVLGYGIGLGRSTRLDLEAWWNLALESKGSSTHRDEVFELDLTLALSHELSEAFLVWAGSTFYWLPRADVGPTGETWSTTEVAAGFEWAQEPAVVAATLVYDLDRYRGWYLDLATEVELAVGGGWALVPRLHLGFARDMDPDPSDPDQEYYYLDDAMVDGELALGLAWRVTESLALRVSGHYVHRFDDVEAEESFGWFGLGLSYTP